MGVQLLYVLGCSYSICVYVKILELCACFHFPLYHEMGQFDPQHQIRLYRWTVSFSIISFEKFSIWLQNGSWCCCFCRCCTEQTEPKTGWKKSDSFLLLLPPPLEIGIIEDETTLMRSNKKKSLCFDHQSHKKLLLANYNKPNFRIVFSHSWLPLESFLYTLRYRNPWNPNPNSTPILTHTHTHTIFRHTTFLYFYRL